MKDPCNIKNLESVRAAIEYYKNTQLACDTPMREFFEFASSL